MKIVSDVMAIFARIDQQVASFQLITGLRCPSGCGSCCATGDIYTTVLEMMPVAHDILCRGEASLWLDRIESQFEDRECVFYQHYPSPDAMGRCCQYTLRPTICRLFGFAAVHRRNGFLELAACKHLKQTQPQEVAHARAYQNQAPCFTHFGTLLKTLDLSGSDLMPINLALRHAIMRLGLHARMAQSENLGTISAA